MCLFHVTASQGVSILVTIICNVSDLVIFCIFCSLVMLSKDDKHVTDESKANYNFKIELLHTKFLQKYFIY
jgi:heme/copper-type cytochrome/quinol oxidase subunit 2